MSFVLQLLVKITLVLATFQCLATTSYYRNRFHNMEDLKHSNLCISQKRKIPFVQVCTSTVSDVVLDRLPPTSARNRWRNHEMK